MRLASFVSCSADCRAVSSATFGAARNVRFSCSVFPAHHPSGGCFPPFVIPYRVLACSSRRCSTVRVPTREPAVMPAPVAKPIIIEYATS